MLGVGILFTAVSSYFAWGIIGSAGQQKSAAATYQPVQATVLSSKVSSHRTSNPGATGNITTYQPRIEFEYQVEGETYRSTRFAYMTSGYEKEDVEGIVKRYPVGSQCTAYVDPVYPQKAILHRGVSEGGFSMAYVVAGILVGTGLLMMVGGWLGWLRDLK